MCRLEVSVLLSCQPFMMVYGWGVDGLVEGAIVDAVSHLVIKILLGEEYCLATKESSHVQVKRKSGFNS